ncbi:MAG: hypothetical protein BA866_08365 [Desulfobulbaceae bacterium S5133MH15]|nr:MAG: hypothetical protein BA866_08365 [Desulfobulbaceae bacterium S5133MH15]
MVLFRRGGGWIFCLSSPPTSPEGEADGGQVERQKNYHVNPINPVEKDMWVMSWYSIVFVRQDLLDFLFLPFWMFIHSE